MEGELTNAHYISKKEGEMTKQDNSHLWLKKLHNFDFFFKKKERVITKQHEHPLAVKIEHFLIKPFSSAKELIYVN